MLCICVFCVCVCVDGPIIVCNYYVLTYLPSFGLYVPDTINRSITSVSM
jgi:hypothetical protein